MWKTDDGPTATGKLELGEDELVLSGAASEVHVPFAELSAVEVGRDASERINGGVSVVLERNSCERVLIGALGGIGLVGELTELLARIRAECRRQARAAVIVPIKPGAVEAARRLIEKGPPFDLERLGLARHHVFLSEQEVVFLFEGEDACVVIDLLSRSPAVLRAALRWRNILAGQPRLAQERFGWTAAAKE